MRHDTHTVGIGGVKMGSRHPIVIQTMTNTDTADVEATVAQCKELADAGAEIIRVTVNTDAAAKAIPRIVEQIEVPIVGDFHFIGAEILEDNPDCTKALAKLRINPGNEHGFDDFIKIAVAHNKPVRIGVNFGSLDQKLLTTMMDKNAESKDPKSDREVIVETMVKSALDSAKQAEKLGLAAEDIVLSVKMSNANDTIEAYERLAKKCKYALHIGLTEAGPGTQGLVSSSAALAVLLKQGIGDTIRYSLTPAPGSSRTEEVLACKELLQSLELRQFKPHIVSCPGCGRTDNQFFQNLTAEISNEIEKLQARFPEKMRGLKIAIMGCAVNGPGEARAADIAISLPGKAEKPVAPVYVKGKFHKSLSGATITEDFMTILESLVQGDLPHTI